MTTKLSVRGLFDSGLVEELAADMLECSSSDKRIANVAADCSSVELVGTESSGGEAEITVGLKGSSLKASLPVKVYFPSAASIRITALGHAGDVVLHKVKGWPRQSAAQNGVCSERWQDTKLTIFAQFSYLETNVMVDVTAELESSIQSSNEKVLRIKGSVSMAQAAGRSTVVLNGPSGKLGTLGITVTATPVRVQRLFTTTIGDVRINTYIRNGAEAEADVEVKTLVTGQTYVVKVSMVHKLVAYGQTGQVRYDFPLQLRTNFNLHRA